jgi:hypothetical protein
MIPTIMTTTAMTATGGGVTSSMTSTAVFRR